MVMVSGQIKSSSNIFPNPCDIDVHLLLLNIMHHAHLTMMSDAPSKIEREAKSVMCDILWRENVLNTTWTV